MSTGLTDEQIGLAITEIAAGIDTFEQAVNEGHGIIDDEGLIPLYLGRDQINERRYKTWERVESDIEEIASGIEENSEGPRKMFLTKLVESIRVAVHLFRGGELDYKEKLRRLVGVPAEPIDDAFIDGLADTIDAELSGRGFRDGTLTDRIVAWEGSRSVDATSIPDLYNELMREARDRTDRMVVPTDGYWMELNPVRGTHYTARCNFVGKRMDLNMDNQFSRSALKHLVAHECFPGHSTQNIYTLKSFKEGRATADVLLCSLNGITGVMQEGIGDQGVQLIDWIEDADDRIQTTLRRFRSAIATNGAWKLNVDGVADDDVYAYFRETGAMQEARARGRIRMAHHPFRGPFIASYFYGNEVVRLVRRATEHDADTRTAFVQELYGKMHSPESLCEALNVPYRSYGDE